MAHILKTGLACTEYVSPAMNICTTSVILMRHRKPKPYSTKLLKLAPRNVRLPSLAILLYHDVFERRFNTTFDTQLLRCRILNVIVFLNSANMVTTQLRVPRKHVHLIGVVQESNKFVTAEAREAHI